MRSELSFPSDVLSIVPWADEVIDTLGFDPRSPYVETYWLGVLGPSTTWLIRRWVAELDRHPNGFELPLAETARQLGLGDRGGRHSPFLRAITRTVQFDLAEPVAEGVLAVRRKVPPLNRRQLLHLSPAIAGGPSPLAGGAASRSRRATRPAVDAASSP